MVLNTKGIHNSFWRNFLAKAKQMPSKVLFVGKKMPVGNSKWVKNHQPRTQACSRYPSDQRRLGTERDRRIFPTSLTGDVTSEIAEDDWEDGWKIIIFVLNCLTVLLYTKRIIHLSVGGLWWIFTSLRRGLVNREFTQRRRRQQRERLKSKIFRQAKQHLCTYISLPSLHDYNVELPNFTFCRGREQKTTTFFFFTWTLMQSFRVHLQKICQHLTNWTRWNKRD